MLNSIIASTAILATSALVSAQGSAVVVNSCNYDVHLTNVPASGGGESQVGPQTLSSGGSYSQVFTELTNGMGWSLKLSKDASLSNIMQYEYTFHNDGTIWYDLSDVNGNPWDGNWEITATGDCTPKQSAYRFSTDDAYGMQSCPDSSSITVRLCSGSSSVGSPSSPAESWGAPSVPAPSVAAPSVAAPSIPAVSSAAAEASKAAGHGGHHQWGPPGGDKIAADGDAQNLGANKKHHKGHGGHTVTSTHIEIVTEVVTAGGAPTKRAEHLHRHAHHHERF